MLLLKRAGIGRYVFCSLFSVNVNMEIALLFVIHIYFVFQAGALVYIELQIT